MPEFNGSTFVKKVTRPIPCPLCAEIGLEIHEVLIAMPVGSFSLAGNQPKMPAEQAIFLHCPNCKASVKGAVSEDGHDLFINPEDMCA